MIKTDVVIIGGSQAGLGMSSQLTRLGVSHLVLERSAPGARWRSERWKTLRLLTPNWQSRLGRGQLGRWTPGAATDPNGFLRGTDFAEALVRYSENIDAPLLCGVEVVRLEMAPGGGYVIYTSGETIGARAVVVATGQCARPKLPDFASALSTRVHSLHSRDYQSPEELGAGGVLVVGASATGIQLAQEIRRSGRRVVLSAGPHTRMPRRYRGRDIMAWFELAGITRDPAIRGPVDRAPSLQLMGTEDHRDVDLEILKDEGVEIVGSLDSVKGERVDFRSDLRLHLAESRTRMLRTLGRIDASIHALGWEGVVPEAFVPNPVELPPYRGAFELRREGISTVVWATGYRSHMPFLPRDTRRLDGEPIQEGGIGVHPGLFFLGLEFMRHRFSATISGVQDDARFLAEVVFQHLEKGIRRAS